MTPSPRYPLCIFCKHLVDNFEIASFWRCTAFPEGIPANISGQWDHYIDQSDRYILWDRQDLENIFYRDRFWAEKYNDINPNLMFPRYDHRQPIAGDNGIRYKRGSYKKMMERIRGSKYRIYAMRANVEMEYTVGRLFGYIRPPLPKKSL